MLAADPSERRPHHDQEPRRGQVRLLPRRLTDKQGNRSSVSVYDAYFGK
ncbi:hypothetical protein [Streptomyces sp. SA15]|nr:hypothetical protein [Streptomyces sp. SA15]